jgi:magnesium transporter
MKAKRRRRRAARRVVGEVPGTLRVDAEAAPSVVRVMAYGPDAYEEREIDNVESLREILHKSPVTWVNVDGLGNAEAIGKVGQIFDIHPLALEDVVHVHQRAKVEQYERQLFIVTRMVSLGERLETEQMSIFLGEDFVLTFQEHPGDCLDPVRDRIRKGTGRVRKAQADYLAYALLDAVIDGYFPLLEEYGERLEALEEQVITRPDAQTVARIHAAKREMLVLRRAVWPQREAVNSLLREELALIAEPTRLYLRDCYDHVIQIIDMLETYREICSGLLDAYQSSVSNRMNEVMKVLTIIATIFIPLGFVAGLYGMNFDPEKSPFNMPELKWYWGYPTALTIMAVVALGMLLFFWRKGWLGSSTPAREPDEPTDGNQT